MRISAVVVIFMTLCLAGVSRAAEVDCVSCHKDLTEGKTVHSAVMMGCAVCHTGVDATKVPDQFLIKTVNLNAIRALYCVGYKEGQPLPVMDGIKFAVVKTSVPTGKEEF